MLTYISTITEIPTATPQIRAFCSVYVPVWKHVRESNGRHMKVSTSAVFPEGPPGDESRPK